MKASVLAPESLELLLRGDAADKVRRARKAERYDLLSFGGGSCPKVVGRQARDFGWKDMCFLTNGSDNGGSTQKIVEALRRKYGPTLPVGDVTSALIGLLDPFRYSLLNLRGWKLDPGRFTKEEQAAFLAEAQRHSSFSARLQAAMRWHLKKFEDSDADAAARERFCAELIEAGRMVDSVGLIRPGVKGLDISEASIRHHVFNALMMRIGAYDSARKTPDSDRFMIGLALLQKAFAIEHAVFPCSIDEQILYAEWVDGAGKVVWTTKQTTPDRPVVAVGGQVALSNAPDSVKRLADSSLARYGRYGFDPALPQPKPYPEALVAIGLLKPGAPILYGPSSFVASTAPCLAVSGISAELAKRADCPKILFMNLTLNSETVGWTVADYLDFWELNTGMPVSRTIDYIVVNNLVEGAEGVADALTDKGDTLETFKFRGPVKLSDAERAALPERGVNIVEAPLASVSQELMRLSSAGEREFVWVPSHNSKLLMQVCRLLVKDFAAKSKSLPAKDKLALDTPGKPDAVIYRKR